MLPFFCTLFRDRILAIHSCTIALQIPFFLTMAFPALQCNVGTCFALQILLNSLGLLGLENMPTVDWRSSSIQLLGIASLSWIEHSMSFWWKAKPSYSSSPSVESSSLDSSSSYQFRHHHVPVPQFPKVIVNCHVFESPTLIFRAAIVYIIF